MARRLVFSKTCKRFNKFVLDKERDQGIKTSQDARFYALSTKFDKFSNRGKTLVAQFTVKHEQGIDCGGGYIKVSGLVGILLPR
jgi:calreticulin